MKTFPEEKHRRVEIRFFHVLPLMNISLRHYRSFHYDLYPLVHPGRSSRGNIHWLVSIVFVSFQVIPLAIDDCVIPQINQEEMTPSIDSVLIPSSIDETYSLPTIIPCLSPIPGQNIWPDVLSIDSPRQQAQSSKTKRFKSAVNQSSSNIDRHDESHSLPIHSMIDNFKDQVTSPSLPWSLTHLLSFSSINFSLI